MKFINKYVLAYSFIIIIATLLIYFSSIKLTGMAGTVFSLACIAVIPLSMILIKRRDEYQGFSGFNYHLVTYIVTVGVPLGLHAAGVLPDVAFVTPMASIWGTGLLIHFFIFIFGFRKRRIGNYDKREIFK